MKYPLRILSLLLVFLFFGLHTACDSQQNRPLKKYNNDTLVDTPWGVIVAKTDGVISHPGRSISLQIWFAEIDSDFQKIDKISWAIFRMSNLVDPLAQGESKANWKKNDAGKIQIDIDNLFPSPTQSGTAWGVLFPYGEYGIITRFYSNEKEIATSKPIPISLKPIERD